MCTYNGAAFVAQQLQSIAAQTRLPDEVVICDDRSTDNTCAIIDALQLPFPVRLSVNETNLGSTSNFARAIGLCEGQVIALSDQDDVWLPEKMACIEQAFVKQPDLGLFASDAEIVDDQLRSCNERLWETIPFTEREQEQFQKGHAVQLLMRCNVITGATAAFNAALRDILLPIPECWVHDYWIAFVAALVAEVRLCPDPLIRYRRHGAQQIGVPSYSVWRQIKTARKQDTAYFEKLATCFGSLRERLSLFRARIRRPDFFDTIQSREEMARAQAQMRRARRISRMPYIFGQLARRRYGTYGQGLFGWKTLAADLFL